MNLLLEGKRVIVTGASRGIGACIAREFAKEGAALALVARSESELRKLADELDTPATPVVGDLSSAESLADALGRSVEALGGVDVLVNNAGASPFGSFDIVSEAEWEAAFALKLMGYARCIRAVLSPMRAQRSGTVVNVVGAAGRNATAGYVLGAFNAALLHLTRSLAELLAPDGIRVSAVNPGFTNTARVRRAMETWAREVKTDAESYAREYAARLPLGRFSEPEEIARVVVVSSSPVMELTSGSALQVDGGSAGGQF